MPPKVLPLSLATVLMCTTLASAQVDLGALLESIGFPDESSAKVEIGKQSGEPAELPQQQPAVAPPAPNSPADAPDKQPAANPGIREIPEARPFSEGMISPPVDNVAPRVPQASDQNLPIQVPSSRNAGTVQAAQDVDFVGRIDLQSLSNQEVVGAIEVNPNASCGHNHDCQGSCVDCCAEAKPVKVARCYPSPVLPRPATTDEYFSTPRCYNNLWGTYAAEKACECRLHHKHIHETCDCAEKSAEAKRRKANSAACRQEAAACCAPH